MNKGIIFATSSGLSPRNVGAYRIATFVRQQGWDVEVVDYLSYWTLEELKLLARTRITADVKFIGLSFLFIDTYIEPLEQFIVWLKCEYPHLVVIGGTGTSANHVPAKGIDYMVRGFGEHAFVALLKYLFSNGPCPSFALTDMRVKTIDANTFYPAFPMEDLTADYEDRDFVGSHEWLMLEASRGCRFSCAYCSFPVLGVKDDYTRSGKNLRDQLQKTYDRYGVVHYDFSDDTFNDSTEKITKFADALQGMSFRPRFSAYIRPDLLIRRPHEREELLRLNVLTHFYGIETMNPKSGKAVGKGLMGDELKEGLLGIRRYFETHGEYFRTTMSMIYGLPYETLDTIKDTEDWYVRHWQQHQVLAGPLRINTLDSGIESKITMDYAKYGYREIDPDRLNYMAVEYAKKHPSCADVFLNAYDDPRVKRSSEFAEMRDSVVWENDNMNILDAVVAAKRWKRTKANNDFRHGAFEMGYLSRTDTLEQRLGPIGDRSTLKLKYIRMLGLVEEYKQNKLNWTPSHTHSNA